MLYHNKAWYQIVKLIRYLSVVAHHRYCPLESFKRLFDGLRLIYDFAPTCEITLEANPGTLEHSPLMSISLSVLIAYPLAYKALITTP